MNLEKRGDYMLLYYQRRRFRIKCSCSIAFLRNVEPQGSAEYNASACFVPRLFLLMSHLNEQAGYKSEFAGTKITLVLR